MARLSLIGLLAVPWLLLAGLASGDAVTDLQNKGRPSIDAQLAKSTTCTKDKLKVRREWCVLNPPVAVSHELTSPRTDISTAEKKEYIAAMLCIMQKPSKLDPTKFPGAKSRYDDFVVVHMNQTLNIHGTVRYPTSATHLPATNPPRREASSHGTATIPGRLSAPCRQSAGLPAPSP